MDWSGWSIGWFMGLAGGCFWVIFFFKSLSFIDKWVGSKLERRRARDHHAIDGYFRIVRWACDNYHTDKVAMAFYNNWYHQKASEVCGMHIKMAAQGKLPVMMYPEYMRTKLFKAMYPDNGYYLAQWMRTNHPEVLKEYRIARKARERLEI